MTTIAYRDGIMAADSLVVSVSDVRRGHGQKITRLKDGGLLGFCGGTGYQPLIVQWLNNGAEAKDRPVIDKEDGGVAGLLVRQDGATYTFGNGLLFAEVEALYLAAGSGNELALGAMAAGLSAENAVKIACQLDVFSGLPVRAVPLITEQEKPDAVE